MKTKIERSTMKAYKGTMTKKETLAQLRAHHEADEIVQGTYWSDGKGCAVGCLTHDSSGGHEKYPKMWGIPEPLAYLEDTLFESLSVENSKEWPTRFMSAIPESADLSRCWDRWQAWCLRDLVQIAEENAHVVEVMAVLFERAGNGDEPSEAEWSEVEAANDKPSDAPQGFAGEADEAAAK